MIESDEAYSLIKVQVFQKSTELEVVCRKSQTKMALAHASPSDIIKTRCQQGL